MSVGSVPVAIAVRLWLGAAILRVLKRIVPLERLVRLAHREPHGARDQALEARLRAYMAMRGRFPRRPPGNCLERSLGAYRILCAAGAAPELVIGVRRAGLRQVEGHVWVRCSGSVVGESDDDVASYA